ncbi:inhibitor of KinA sporulation pathway (predicted exonuclease) [Mobilisporobacter senegalensis]|uniref:Inhibitor of KinA sporulation pathway (Predicted exonuclease) n=1 Tax=Mobilisporobacter senegalensis TaxID=1329262 RepID=A0A3N1XKR5_9FIRM|nr:3'-5' exonuclease [Mobilisporobacter senegalensis]ROR27266.1 inhibitor of KinA sporulation pathway (predicted exonuclease) [Mobilisporobacter senegalensis]
MNYIVFDLEFNQDITSLKEYYKDKSRFPFEIIQIGALKLDIDYKTIATFNHLIKPVIYTNIAGFITELTGITMKELEKEKSFPVVFKEFLDFIGQEECILCTWGTSDMKELYRNISYHQIDHKNVPDRYINIQPFTSLHVGISKKELLSLENAVSILDIPTTYKFHDALSDAYYTAEIFKKVYHPLILPNRYDPNFVPIKPRPKKITIDFYGLIKQFEKMYGREMNSEEQEMIKLAYKMGRTNQFAKTL